MKKILTGVLAASCFLLCSCGNTAGGTEIPSALPSVSEDAETTAVSETSEPAKTSPEAAMSESLTEVSAETEITEEIPEETTATEPVIEPITAEKCEYSEDICNKGGRKVCEFKAEYPVFSGGYAGTAEIINSHIKGYIDEMTENARAEASNGYDSITEIDDYSTYGYVWTEGTVCGSSDEYSDIFDFTLNGNILSVCLIRYYYSAGAAHGSSLPYNMMFDVNTGEIIDINDFVGNKRDFAVLMDVSAKKYMSEDENSDYYGGCFENETFEEAFSYILDALEYYDDEYLKNGENGLIFKKDASVDIDCSRFAVKDNKLCLYIAPYEYGSYADGIRCIELDSEKVLELLNDMGKEILEDVLT